MKLAAALLSLVSAAASAQAWRADMESGTGAEGLVAVVCLGIAFFYVRNEYRRSQTAGNLALTVCVAIGVAALCVPAVRSLLALVTAAFFIYGLIRRS